MATKEPVRLGAVQETLLITLLGRAQQARRRNPVFPDPKAVEIAEQIEFGRYAKSVGGMGTVLRTAVYDSWVRSFLAEHPGGTVVELGTGLNTRFERVDNGRVHWLDLDLPDTIELRRRFFTDTGRRRMLAASVLDEGWMDVVAELPGPYFFVSEGVLVYLEEDAVLGGLGRIATRFPGALLAVDTYRRAAFRWQHKAADAGKMDARWTWSCEDPATLERVGLRRLTTNRATQPPLELRRRLPLSYRVGLPLADLVIPAFFEVSLFRTR